MFFDSLLDRELYSSADFVGFLGCYDHFSFIQGIDASPFQFV